jgi:hypothetical protein
VDCRVLNLLGAGIDVAVAYHVIRNELGEVHQSLWIKLNGFSWAKGNLFGLSLLWGCTRGQDELVNLAGVAVTGLIKAYAAIHERFIYYDLFSQDFTTVLDYG